MYLNERISVEFNVIGIIHLLNVFFEVKKKVRSKGAL